MAGGNWRGEKKIEFLFFQLRFQTALSRISRLVWLRTWPRSGLRIMSKNVVDLQAIMKYFYMAQDCLPSRLTVVEGLVRLS